MIVCDSHEAGTGQKGGARGEHEKLGGGQQGEKIQEDRLTDRQIGTNRQTDTQAENQRRGLPI
eukprot:6199071-Pleurochrysis_carterae.AAC.2